MTETDPGDIELVPGEGEELKVLHRTIVDGKSARLPLLSIDTEIGTVTMFPYLVSYIT